ncbi:hypothetical protein [Prevotella sp. E13-27]|uniref:hypothetical protein n=1 Tax=Prevotella sp. E13-27 TaxID=2938122 RepID=UPI00200B43B5|nr:hypothetical protein [Prevotella sp. E13-27]MCK8622360.1 hypothetical protein [Prevotella sp. E13-27]
MRIKNLIRRWLGHSVIVVESSPDIYVADMTNRSQNTRGIEITDHQQPSPDGNGMMDSLVFHNPNILSVDFCIFDDHDFKHPYELRDDKHCEGCMYPTLHDPASWMVFVEIKDCKPQYIKEYKKEAKRQIFNAVKAFCHRKIILKERIYGIISCPRQHVAFNDSIFTDVYEVTRLKHFTGIRYYATNEALIIDDLRVRPEI